MTCHYCNVVFSFQKEGLIYLYEPDVLKMIVLSFDNWNINITIYSI